MIKLLAKLFYKEGIDHPNETTNTTPLMLALFTGQREVAQFFMKKFKANQNHRNIHGETILHIA